ncbi:MAG: flippase-like domain-containing protein [Thermanaerothrix sp.]|nr:flippase-like domain-containing protein [Thermanaerothrix sp.]
MTVRRGLSLFLIVVVCVGIGTILATTDGEAIELVLKADKTRLAIALFLVPLVWLFDSLRFSSLIRASGNRIPLKLSFMLIWINYFGCAITPMQSGGGPFQIYLLYKNGVPVGKGVAVTLVRTMLTLLVLGLAIPVTMVMSPDILLGESILKDLAIYVASALGLIWVVITISLIKPAFVKRISAILTLLLKRLGVVKPQRVLKIVRHVNAEVDIYNENMRTFWSQGKSYVLLGAFFTFCQQLVQLSVLPCLIWAMGLPVEYLKSILIQALLLFALYFIPTPGGSGAAEGGGAAAFRLLVPSNLAGLLAVLWRVITEYTGVLLGTIMVVKILGFNMADDLISKTEEEIDRAGNV